MNCAVPANAGGAPAIKVRVQPGIDVLVLEVDDGSIMARGRDLRMGSSVMAGKRAVRIAAPSGPSSMTTAKRRT